MCSTVLPARLLIIALGLVPAAAAGQGSPAWPEVKLEAGETRAPEKAFPSVVRWVARSGDPVTFVVASKDGRGLLRAIWRANAPRSQVLATWEHLDATSIVDMSNGEISLVTHQSLDRKPDLYEAWRFRFDRKRGFTQAKHARFNAKQRPPRWASPPRSRKPVVLAFDTVAYLLRRQDERVWLYFDAEPVKLTTAGGSGGRRKELRRGVEIKERWLRAGAFPVVPYAGACKARCCKAAGRGFERWARVERICFSADKERPKVRELVVVDAR